MLSTVALALLLGGLELGLRLAGFGVSPHLFRRTRLPGGEAGWSENRDVTVPYFSAALARRPFPVRLAADKAPGTYRIFILGSSAAMGDPEPSFSLARMLEVMLRTAYPEQRFEVVNAAITAINSHLVRGLAEDCATLQPDLFIVYEGNNEVIGPFGPAGVFAPFLQSERAVRTVVWLKGTRTGQLLSRATARKLPPTWGGMEMFLQQQITADDPRLDAVRAHFAANLAAIVGSARRAGAATLLCTVGTNQRDFPPFLSPDGEADRAYRAALAAVAAGHADKARPLFQRALDHDALRFRADSTLNQVIRDTRFPPGTAGEVVDLAAGLAAQCLHGVGGNEFFYEHVHFTLRGTYAAAALLLPAIERQLQGRGLAAAAKAVPGFEEASLRLGCTVYEQTMIATGMVNRFSRPPFNTQWNQADRLARWQRLVEQGNILLERPDANDALRTIARRAIEFSPDDWVLARNAGAMLVARQLPAEALPLLERAATSIDDDPDTFIALGWAHHALGHTAEADAAFAKARALEPNYPNLPAPVGQ